MSTRLEWTAIVAWLGLRPVAKALGTGLLTTAIDGVGNPAFDASLLMIACSSGCSVPDTYLALVIVRTILSLNQYSPKLSIAARPIARNGENPRAYEVARRMPVRTAKSMLVLRRFQIISAPYALQSAEISLGFLVQDTATRTLPRLLFRKTERRNFLMNSRSVSCPLCFGKIYQGPTIRPKCLLHYPLKAVSTSQEKSSRSTTEDLHAQQMMPERKPSALILQS